MFGFGKPKGKNQRLNTVLNTLQMDMENNYKDNAQMDYKRVLEVFAEEKEAGNLKGKQLEFYETKIKELEEPLRKFTHKDQIATWVL